MLPEFFGKRSRYGTPLTGILFSASGVFLLSWLSFQEIVAAENFLYCFGIYSICMVKGKTSHSISALQDTWGNSWSNSFVYSSNHIDALSTLKVFLVSIDAVMIRLVMQPCLKYVEKKRWIKFSTNCNLLVLTRTLMLQ